MLTFPMSENAKHDISRPYFECIMDEIDEIGQSAANSSLLHHFCMVKSYFDAYFVCPHFVSLKKSAIFERKTSRISQISYMRQYSYNVSIKILYCAHNGCRPNFPSKSHRSLKSSAIFAKNQPESAKF